MRGVSSNLKKKTPRMLGNFGLVTNFMSFMVPLHISEIYAEIFRIFSNDGPENATF